MQSYIPISTLGRFYIYAIHGYVVEVMFTAAWEFVVNYNWKFPGNTSVWALFIYGLSTMVIEKLYFYFKKRNIPWYVRAAIYTAWSFIWEFSTGWVLQQFNACPWDYSDFENDFMGLVTLEYLPLWYMAGLVAEQVVIKHTNKLRWEPEKEKKES